MAIKTINGVIYHIIKDDATIIGSHTDILPGDLVIPEKISGAKVKAIGPRAFVRAFFKSVTIPDSVIRIDEQAFSYCNTLEEIVLNSQKICINAFFECTSLKSVVFKEKVETIEDNAFCSCFLLKNIHAEGYIKKISATAFHGTAFYNDQNNWENGMLYFNNHLLQAREDVPENVFVKKGTRSIEARAFSDQKHIKKIALPNSVTSIEFCAFKNCTSLSEIALSNKLESIDGFAFENCESLKSIIIPDTVLCMGAGVFHNCASLRNVKLSEEISFMHPTIFLNCIALKKIVMPEKLQTIDSSVFEGCVNLETVVLKNEITAIHNRVFLNCVNLKNIELPEALKFIGDKAFANCKSLTSINIPDSVNHIGTRAFANCSKLKTMTFPTELRAINEGILWGCSSLQHLVLAKSASFLLSDTARYYQKLQHSLLVGETTPCVSFEGDKELFQKLFSFDIEKEGVALTAEGFHVPTKVICNGTEYIF